MYFDGPWQYKRVALNLSIDDDEGQAQLDKLLREGWEPFAVTQPNAITYMKIHLKKREREYVNMGPA